MRLGGQERCASEYYSRNERSFNADSNIEEISEFLTRTIVSQDLHNAIQYYSYCRIMQGKILNLRKQPSAQRYMAPPIKEENGESGTQDPTKLLDGGDTINVYNNESMRLQPPAPSADNEYFSPYNFSYQQQGEMEMQVEQAREGVNQSCCKNCLLI